LRDQNAISPDTDLCRAQLGQGEDAGRQEMPDAIDFRAPWKLDLARMER
jgi:hypothetical protein